MSRDRYYEESPDDVPYVNDCDDNEDEEEDYADDSAPQALPVEIEVEDPDQAFTRAAAQIASAAMRFKQVAGDDAEHQAFVPNCEEHPLSGRIPVSAFCLRMAHQLWSQVRHNYRQDRNSAVAARFGVQQTQQALLAASHALLAKMSMHPGMNPGQEPGPQGSSAEMAPDVPGLRFFAAHAFDRQGFITYMASHMSPQERAALISSIQGIDQPAQQPTQETPPPAEPVA